MIPLPLGLVSWILIGLFAGWSAARMLPGEPPLGTGATTGIGFVGAMLGGLLATALGFGGLLGFDIRALVTATLSSVLCLLLWRIVRLAR